MTLITMMTMKKRWVKRRMRVEADEEIRIKDKRLKRYQWRRDITSTDSTTRSRRLTSCRLL